MYQYIHFETKCRLMLLYRGWGNQILYLFIPSFLFHVVFVSAFLSHPSHPLTTGVDTCERLPYPIPPPPLPTGPDTSDPTPYLPPLPPGWILVSAFPTPSLSLLTGPDNCERLPYPIPPTHQAGYLWAPSLPQPSPLTTGLDTCERLPDSGGDTHHLHAAAAAADTVGHRWRSVTC